MSFKEITSLDAEVTIAIGKKDKNTGKPYPKQAEGYYLGSRVVQNKRGESKLHFLQTPKGNLGVWGTTDLDRKLGQTALGSMVRITSTGTKPTPNGDMYTYKVEVDGDNSIEVPELAAGAGNESYGGGVGTGGGMGEGDEGGGSEQEEDDDATGGGSYELAAMERRNKVQDLFKNKSK